jgi:hypothetical protein
MKAILQFLSILCGIFAFLLMIPSLIPFLGLGNWLVLPICVLGIIFGVFCDRKIGLTICISVAVVASLRLIAGMGVM